MNGIMFIKCSPSLFIYCYYYYFAELQRYNPSKHQCDKKVVRAGNSIVLEYNDYTTAEPFVLGHT